MSTTLTIAKREFRANFNSPIAYVVICLGLLGLGIFFFYVTGGGFWQQDRATLSQMFSLAPRGLSLLIVPVLTMGLLAEERRSGTLELLITMPVRDHEVIIGKFLGAFGLLCVLILATAVYPILMFRFPWHLGSLDSGPVISGYIGLLLYCSAAVSIGLLVSALTEIQFIAFVVTWFLLVLLSFLGSLAMYVPNATLRNVMTFMSFDARLEMFARGMINTRDVVFFISITIGCLMAAFRALERRKWA